MAALFTIGAVFIFLANATSPEGLAGAASSLELFLALFLGLLLTAILWAATYKFYRDYRDLRREF